MSNGHKKPKEPPWIDNTGGHAAFKFQFLRNCRYIFLYHHDCESIIMKLCYIYTWNKDDAWSSVPSPPKQTIKSISILSLPCGEFLTNFRIEHWSATTCMADLIFESDFNISFSYSDSSTKTFKRWCYIA